MADNQCSGGEITGFEGKRIAVLSTGQFEDKHHSKHNDSPPIRTCLALLSILSGSPDGWTIAMARQS